MAKEEKKAFFPEPQSPAVNLEGPSLPLLHLLTTCILGAISHQKAKGAHRVPVEKPK